MSKTQIVNLISSLFRTCSVLAIVIGLLTNNAWSRQHKSPAPLIIGGDHSFPPYEFLDKDGQPAGYNVELTRSVAEVMGMNIEISLGNWDDMRTALKEGKIDALQGMSFSENRAKFFAFSPPHSIIHQSIFSRLDTDSIDSMQALRGKEVIVQRDGIMYDYIIEHDIGSQLILTNTHGEALRLLSAGKHDFAVVANLPGLYLGRELGLSNISPMAKPLKGQRYGYAVRKGNEDLLAQISEGLAILKNTGRQQAIYDKWLGSLDDGGFPWKKIGQVSAVATTTLLLVLAGIMVWNRMLHRKVEARTQELQLHQQKLIQADKMASLGILVSGVAHEINNPNGFLLLNLPVLREAFDDAKSILEHHHQQHGDFKLGGLPYSRMREEIPLMFSDMQVGSNNIKRIVEDLRNFSRQEDDEGFDGIDLNNIVSIALRMIDNTIQKATNHFQVNYDRDLPQIKGNAQRIEQVVINLMLNACQSLENTEKRITLLTCYNADDGCVELKVTDEGKGIEQEYLCNLTDPFFTTKRDSGGTGLGLFISAGIARDHGGALHFHSTLSEGTIATLSLPVATENN